VGDVQAAETHPACFGQERPGGFSVQAELFDIDQLVEVLQAQLVRFPFMQLRAE
jgi:hypothetical protein